MTRGGESVATLTWPAKSADPCMNRSRVSVLVNVLMITSSPPTEQETASATWVARVRGTRPVQSTPAADKRSANAEADPSPARVVVEGFAGAAQPAVATAKTRSVALGPHTRRWL